MYKLIPIFLCLFVQQALFGQTLPIDSLGEKLKQFYVNQHVESLWCAGQHINWETGQPDNPNAKKGIKTHCSAFVASVCKQKNIYILRPPEHKTGLLANAQFDWLLSDNAFKIGWRPIQDSNIYVKAQQLANMGRVVVAVYKNTNAKKPGHIALVMPTEKTITNLLQEGPTVIQAGNENRNAISLKKGFKHHIKTWETASKIILFYYYAN